MELQTQGTNCLKSFSGWLPLSFFHAEPILNKHSCTYKEAKNPWSNNACKHPSAHTHTFKHSLSNTAYSQHAKRGVTATRGEWVPNRLEQMKRWGESKHIGYPPAPSFPYSLSTTLCACPLMSDCLSDSALTDAAFHPLALLIFLISIEFTLVGIIVNHMPIQWGLTFSRLVLMSTTAQRVQVTANRWLVLNYWPIRDNHTLWHWLHIDTNTSIYTVTAP